MEDAGPEKKPAAWWRLAALVVIIGGLVAVARFTGLTDEFSVEGIREAMDSAGVWGVGLFLVAFAVGELMHVPGLVFVAAAVLAYGRLVGGLVAYAGAIIAVSVSFVVVRFIGGQLLATSERPWFRKALDALEDKPVRVVVVLRLILWMAPPVNYALAVSNIRFRDYLVGSVLGLVLPVALASFFIEWVVATFL